MKQTANLEPATTKQHLLPRASRVAPLHSTRLTAEATATKFNSLSPSTATRRCWSEDALDCQALLSQRRKLPPAPCTGSWKRALPTHAGWLELKIGLLATEGTTKSRLSTLCGNPPCRIVLQFPPAKFCVLHRQRSCPNRRVFGGWAEPRHSFSLNEGLDFNE